MTQSRNPDPPQAARIPRPAHPVVREEPLPVYEPKSEREDPEAPRRLKAIVASPSYRPADDDADFLARPDVRGIRLQLDYLKPETLLNQSAIHHTIVVFGSTRIVEPAAAQRDGRRTCKADWPKADPTIASSRGALAVAERVLAKSRYYEVARDFGRLVGEANMRPTISAWSSRPAAGRASWRRPIAAPTTSARSRSGSTSPCRTSSSPTPM